MAEIIVDGEKINAPVSVIQEAERLFPSKPGLKNQFIRGGARARRERDRVKGLPPSPQKDISDEQYEAEEARYK